MVKPPPFRKRLTPTDQVTDLVESVKIYARQETLGPLKGAARWVAIGTWLPRLSDYP
jgi:hypothetical protein